MHQERRHKQAVRRTSISERAVKGYLIAGAAALTIGISTLVIRSASSTETMPPQQTSASSESPNTSPDSLPPSRIIDLNLRKPNSPLLSGLRDMHDRYGKVVQFFDCSQDTDLSSNTTISPVNLREAPTRLSKTVGNLVSGEGFEGAIEAVVSSLYRNTPAERWLAKINGTDLTFAAREEAYRTYLVRDWSTTKKCEPINISDDYIKTNLAPLGTK